MTRLRCCSAGDNSAYLDMEVVGDPATVTDLYWFNSRPYSVYVEMEHVGVRTISRAIPANTIIEEQRAITKAQQPPLNQVVFRMADPAP